MWRCNATGLASTQGSANFLHLTLHRDLLSYQPIATLKIVRLTTMPKIWG